jgi:hypothetical protein
LISASAISAGDDAQLRTLQKRIDYIESDLRGAESIRAVKRLQYAYGHYAEQGLDYIWTADYQSDWDRVSDKSKGAVAATFPEIVDLTFHYKRQINRKYDGDEGGAMSPLSAFQSLGGVGFLRRIGQTAFLVMNPPAQMPHGLPIISI